MVCEYLEHLLKFHDLSREQANTLMREIMEGKVPPSQLAALLTALRMKGETVEELTGFAETMRAYATQVKVNRRPLVDTCGTGGDKSYTFNISTVAAFVVAGAGIAVAKHGNRSASSRCGSADVLEALGVRIDAPVEVVTRCIEQIGIGFLFARQFHGAMRHVAGVRKELGFRTVFNLLGPLCNPAGVDSQLVGVFDEKWLEPVAQVLLNLGARHVIVVIGSDGVDEITLDGVTHVIEGDASGWRRYELAPEELGYKRASRTVLQGGNAQENAAIIRSILEGEKGPRRDIVVLNAAAGILVGGGAKTWQEACEVAEHSIDSGAALNALNGLIEVSHVAG